MGEGEEVIEEKEGGGRLLSLVRITVVSILSLALTLSLSRNEDEQTRWTKFVESRDIA